jgi:hypothetical protein
MTCLHPLWNSVHGIEHDNATLCSVKVGAMLEYIRWILAFTQVVYFITSRTIKWSFLTAFLHIYLPVYAYPPTHLPTHVSLYLISQTIQHFSMKFFTVCLYEKLSSEFNFCQHRPNITLILQEVEIKIYIFLYNGESYENCYIITKYKIKDLACRKRRLKWVVTLPLGDINTEAWSSGMGVRRAANNPIL